MPGHWWQIAMTTGMLAVVCQSARALGGDGMPDAWRAAASAFDLFAVADANTTMMPALGNGVFGFEAGELVAFHSGLFTGGSCSDAGGVPGARASSNSGFTPPIPVAFGALGSKVVASGPVWSGLDIRRAVFVKQFNASVGGATQVQVVERSYAHWVLPDLLVHEVNVSWLSGPASHVEVVCPWGKSSGGGMQWKVQSANSLLGRVLEPEVPGATGAEIAVFSSCLPASGEVGPGAAASWLFTVGLASSLRYPESPESLPERAEAIAVEAGHAGPGRLFEQHELAWATRWSAGSISVEQPVAPAEASPSVPPLAAAINASLYGILASARPDWAHGVSPGGIATSAYLGNRFWDADVWVFPALAMLQRDDVGLSLTGYRTDPMRAQGAAQKARAFGFDGLMFPWQSGESGRELQCGVWGQFEHHITGDVALSLTQMWSLQGGSSSPTAMRWLESAAWPVLLGTAEFWESRVTPLNTSLRAGLSLVPALAGAAHGASDSPPADPVTVAHVMGPDEWHYNISTSAYTNVVAAMNLAAAATAVDAMGLSQYKAHAARWRDTAARLVVLYDSTSGTHPEFLGWANNDTAKQADTILLQFPLAWPGYKASAGSLGRDLAYYQNHTTPSGPAMTWGAFVNGWLAEGAPTSAAELFPRSFANIRAPFWVWSETPTGGAPHFITGAGGWLQTVASGYGGLRPTHVTTTNASGLAGDVVWNPAGPPPGATSMTLHGVDIAACSLRLSVTADRMLAELLGDASEARTCASSPRLLLEATGTLLDLPANVARQSARLVPGSE